MPGVPSLPHAACQDALQLGCGDSFLGRGLERGLQGTREIAPGPCRPALCGDARLAQTRLSATGHTDSQNRHNREEEAQVLRQRLSSAVDGCLFEQCQSVRNQRQMQLHKG